MKNNTCTGRNGLYITSSTLLEQLCVIQRKADSRNDALIWLIHSFKAEFNTKKIWKNSFILSNVTKWLYIGSSYINSKGTHNIMLLAWFISFYFLIKMNLKHFLLFFIILAPAFHNSHWNTQMRSLLFTQTSLNW